jgi:hypothetical protein
VNDDGGQYGERTKRAALDDDRGTGYRGANDDGALEKVVGSVAKR